MISDWNRSICGLVTEDVIPVNDTAAFINDVVFAAVNVPFCVFAFFSNLVAIVVVVKTNSPLSHGGHIGYDVCTLGMKSRRCVSNLRFAVINHAKQRSFQCALMCPCAQIIDQKVN